MKKTDIQPASSNKIKILLMIALHHMMTVVHLLNAQPALQAPAFAGFGGGSFPCGNRLNCYRRGY